MPVFYWKYCLGLYLCLSICLNRVFYFYVPKKIVYKISWWKKESFLFFGSVASHNGGYLDIDNLRRQHLLWHTYIWNTIINKCQFKMWNVSDYHVSVVGVKGLIDERKRVRSQLLLTVDELGKLGKIGFSNKTSVTRVMCDTSYNGRCCQDSTLIKCLNTFV